MTKQAKKNRFGLTPAKLALVAVLALVQVVVIVRAVRHRWASVAEAAPVQASRMAPMAVRPRPAPQPTASPASPAAVVHRRSWPKVSLEEALEFDPFEKPGWLATAIVAADRVAGQQSEMLEQLKQQGASIVVVSGDAKAATIGDQQFRIGDVIDGYQVTDITVRGVEFTKVVPQ